MSKTAVIESKKVQSRVLVVCLSRKLKWMFSAPLSRLNVRSEVKLLPLTAEYLLIEVKQVNLSNLLVEGIF